MSGLKTQIPSIGEMDEIVSFYPVTVATDTGGGKTETLGAAVGNFRAKVTFINTAETTSGVKQEKFTTEIMIMCRYTSTIDDPKLRALWRSKYYDIYAIDVTSRKRFIMIKARSIVT